MPHFDAQGNEEWVCQRGAHICTGPSIWVKGEGNVCSDCLKQPKLISPVLSVHEHCRAESGLTGLALDRYVNRHYGHG